jgi:hypothetical protein
MRAQTVVQHLRERFDEALGILAVTQSVRWNGLDKLTDGAEERVPRRVDLADDVMLFVKWKRCLSSGQLDPGLIGDADVIVVRSNLHFPHVRD